MEKISSAAVNLRSEPLREMFEPFCTYTGCHLLLVTDVVVHSDPNLHASRVEFIIPEFVLRFFMEQIPDSRIMHTRICFQIQMNKALNDIIRFDDVFIKDAYMKTQEVSHMFQIERRRREMSYMPDFMDSRSQGYFPAQQRNQEVYMWGSMRHMVPVGYNNGGGLSVSPPAEQKSPDPYCMVDKVSVPCKCEKEVSITIKKPVL